MPPLLMPLSDNGFRDKIYLPGILFPIHPCSCKGLSHPLHSYQSIAIHQITTHKLIVNDVYICTMVRLRMRQKRSPPAYHVGFYTVRQWANLYFNRSDKLYSPLGIALCFSIPLKGILYLLRHIRFIHTSRDEKLSNFDWIQN